MTESVPGDPTAQSVARRAFLRGAVGAGGVALVILLAACGGSAGVATNSGSVSASGALSTGSSSSAPASTSASTSASSSASSSPSASSSVSASATGSSSALSSSAVTSSATSSASSAAASASSSSATGSSTAAAAARRSDIKPMAEAQTLRVNNGGEPDTIDPNLAEFTYEFSIVRQVFDSLVLLDKDLKPTPGAAESWTTSSDGLTWTFKIRSHKYSDGTPVKAQDFVTSFLRILDPTVAAPYASFFAGVIKGSDAYNSAVVSPPKSGALAGNPVMGPAILAQAATTSSGSMTDTGSATSSGAMSSSSGTESMSMSSSGTGTASMSSSASGSASMSSSASTSAAASTASAVSSSSGSATSAASSAAPAAKATVTPDQLKALRDAVGVKATDDSTLVFTLEQPTGFFLDLVSLANVPPLRADLVSGSNWTADLTKYIGNGPFVMIEHQPQDHITFAPNPNYWGGAPKIGLRYRIITDPNAAFAAYRNGELDINIPPAANVANIKQDPQLSKELSTTPQLGVIWLQYEVKHPPLDNVKFRQALSEAFDRAAYVSDQLKGLGTAATYFIPQGMPGYDANQGQAYKYDPATAKTTFQASGVDAAAASKLKILFTDNALNNQRMSFLSATIKKNLGVTLQLQPQEAKARVAAQKQHNFDLVLTGWFADYPDPQDWYDIWRTGDGNNQGEYSNKQYDQLVKQADGETDASKRLDLYNQAAKLMLDDQPALMMYQSLGVQLVKPYVQGFQPTAQDELPGDYFYKSVSLGQH